VSKEKIIIIGAGPAGLTAALEILRTTDYIPVVLEMSEHIGGLSRTVRYKGNRIDIGGHRFFSKSERVMNWWKEILPVQGSQYIEQSTLSRRESQAPFGSNSEGPNPEHVDKILLVRNRLSRIFFLRKFFNYPLSLNLPTLQKLGILRASKIGVSYSLSMIRPIKPEKSLEDFFINRFGRELYLTFFKSYTEKVWGVSCRKINPSWGAQRIKGLSVRKALLHAFRKIVRYKPQAAAETSLIENFLYPKLGPGQLWEEVARQVKELGGEIHFNSEVKNIRFNGSTIDGIVTHHSESSETTEHTGKYYISSMPVKELILGFEPVVSSDLREIASQLQYRDFITVGVLLKHFKLSEKQNVSDNWIYIQEPDVQVGRIQVFNNWSPYLVKDPDTTWLGLEYFCNVGDQLWSLDDSKLRALAQRELENIGFASAEDVLDSVVIRMEKAYPAYFGSYERFSEIRSFVDDIENLFLIGRNGMHRYNNQDHSMLAAIETVKLIKNNSNDRSKIWNINVEKDYQEE
jgi:protoporphyrinogen oxidase